MQQKVLPACNDKLSPPLGQRLRDVPTPSTRFQLGSHDAGGQTRVGKLLEPADNV